MPAGVLLRGCFRGASAGFVAVASSDTEPDLGTESGVKGVEKGGDGGGVVAAAGGVSVDRRGEELLRYREVKRRRCGRGNGGGM